EALGDVRGDHDDADDAGRGVALRRPDRHEGLDEVPGLKLADRRHLLAGESVLELALVHVAGRNVAEHRILHVHELLTPRVEDRDRADPELLLLLDQVRRDGLAPSSDGTRLNSSHGSISYAVL